MSSKQAERVPFSEPRNLHFCHIRVYLLAVLIFSSFAGMLL